MTTASNLQLGRVYQVGTNGNESQSLERKTFDFTMESVRVVRALVGVA